MSEINRFGDVIRRLSQPSDIERRMSENAAYRKECRQELHKLMWLIEEVVFPSFFSERPILDSISEIHTILRHQTAEIHLDDADSATDIFISLLPDIKRAILEDVEAVAKIDPAVTNISEIIVSYPAVKAMLHYRVAHALLQLNVPIIPRIITEMAHSATGIDIHPAATIGRHFAIDHGTGIVIGATTIIGDNVTLYQGVTLGARNFIYGDDGMPLDVPRHPIIEDNVTIYSNASILGRVRIGHHTVIGGNIWITTDVPPYSSVSQHRPDGIPSFSDGAGI